MERESMEEDKLDMLSTICWQLQCEAGKAEKETERWWWEAQHCGCHLHCAGLRVRGRETDGRKMSEEDKREKKEDDGESKNQVTTKANSPTRAQKHHNSTWGKRREDEFSNSLNAEPDQGNHPGPPLGFILAAGTWRVCSAGKRVLKYYHYGRFW